MGYISTFNNVPKVCGYECFLKLEISLMNYRIIDFMYRIMKFEVLKKETPYLWTYSPFLMYISEITVAKLQIAEQLLFI